jgi:hypothetical protein
MEYEAAEEAEKVYSAFLKREKSEMWGDTYKPAWHGLKTIPFK